MYNTTTKKTPDVESMPTYLAGRCSPGPLPAELGNLSRLLDLRVVRGCPSYSLPLRRGFTR